MVTARKFWRKQKPCKKKIKKLSLILQINKYIEFLKQQKDIMKMEQRQIWLLKLKIWLQKLKSQWNLEDNIEK